ncbi:MAG: rhomboid family intramembrane serine protease, partial [Zetaproteobacteria bacterium]
MRERESTRDEKTMSTQKPLDFDAAAGTVRRTRPQKSRRRRDVFPPFRRSSDVLIPIGHEDQRVTRLPWVTILLVVANVAVFLLTDQIVRRQSADTRQRVHEIVRYASDRPYLNVPPEIRRIVPSSPPRTDLSLDTILKEQSRLDVMWEEFEAATKHTVFRRFGYIPAEPDLLALLTSMFLHGGWLHLLSNMLFLWLAGASLEERWGRLFYTPLYFAGGVAAALTHAVMNPHSAIPMVGASGAIAALMGAFLVRLSMTRIRFFYWFLIVRGTFVMPAYVALPLWLLQQFAMARSGAAGRIAVWAHIGGFLFGVLVAIVVKLTDLEKNILAPGIAKRTTWSPSEALTTALGKLDGGDSGGGIQDLVALLKRNPNSIEARAALATAYTQTGDPASAGRESARLVSAYVVARDMDGALAALDEHRRAHPDVPVPIRGLLALAAHREKQERFREAADLYQAAVQAWPDDPLVPKALIAHGRVMLEVFQQPDEARAILEGALANPRTTPEFRQVAERLMAAAPKAQPAPAGVPEPAPATHEFEPTSLTARGPEPSAPGSSYPTMAEMPSVEIEPSAAALQPETPAEAVPEPPPAQPQVPRPGLEASVSFSPADETDETSDAEQVSGPLAAPSPQWRLAAIPMRAVAIDARGLRLQNREGKIGQLPWQSVAGVSVATIGDSAGTGKPDDRLLVDL